MITPFFLFQAIKEYRLKKDETLTDSTGNKLDNETNNSKNKDRDGILFECELCTRSFCPSHVSLSKPLPATIRSTKRKSQESIDNHFQYPQSLRDIKFLCPNCLRSRRPELETIFSLLVALNKLSVRLPEGEALQCLTERAITWRDRAQRALNEIDVADALKNISLQNTYDTPTAANRYKPIHANAKLLKKYDNENENEADSSSALDTSKTENSENDLEAENYDKSAIYNLDESGHNSKCKSPSSLSPPQVKLSHTSLNTLEELMLEGDLLEVSMDEKQQIWRLLQAVEPRRSKKYPDLDRLQEYLENDRDEKITAKRKRNLELAESQKAGNEVSDAKEEPKSNKTMSSTRNINDGCSNKKQQNQKQRKHGEGSGRKEEPEDCSADPKCQKPAGEEVKENINYHAT